MSPRRAVAWIALASSLLSARAEADVIPNGKRAVGYTMTVENLGDYPDRIFFVYPTSNGLVAYRLEPGKGLTNLMAPSGSRGDPAHLHAMKRADYDKLDPKPVARPHGDDGAVVELFTPPSKALRASVSLSGPGLVEASSPVKSIDRVYRITRLTDDALEIEVKKNEAVLEDGSRRPEPYTPPPPPRTVADTTPKAPVEPAKKSRCAHGEAPPGGAGGLGALAAVLAALLARRGRRREGLPVHSRE